MSRTLLRARLRAGDLVGTWQWGEDRVGCAYRYVPWGDERGKGVREEEVRKE